MENITIHVYSNRKLSKKAIDIGNMQENKVTKLIFEMDEDITALGGNVYLFVSYDGNTYPYPLKDNAIEVGRELTQRKKTEANIVVSTSDDSEDPLKDVVWISNTLTLLTDKNNINIDSINEQELPPSLKIIYDELLALQNDLQKKKDENYWKGEAGKTAYQYAVDGGYTGSEEEFVKELADVENKANSIISTASGQFISITDSAKEKPKNIRLLGGSTQKQYEGNQLIPFPYVHTTKTENGITFTVNDDESVTVNGTAEANAEFILFGEYGATNNATATELTLKGCPTGGSLSTYFMNMAYYKEGSKVGEMQDIGEGCTLSGADFDGVYIYIRIMSGATVSNLVFAPMLNEGTVAKEKEPYTGNAPSPSSTYPQTVEYQGANGSIEGKLLTGNVFNPSYRNTSDKIWCAGCSVTESEGVFTCVATASDLMVWNVIGTGSNYNDIDTACELMEIPDEVSQISVNLSDSTFCKNYVTWFDENKISIGYKYKNESEFTAKPIDGAKYFTIRFGKNDAVVGNTYTTTVMVSYGQPKEYEPYTEQLFTVLTPNGFKSCGNVADEISFADGKHLHYINRKFITSDDYITSNTTNEAYNMFVFTLHTNYHNSDNCVSSNPPVMCNKFIGMTSGTIGKGKCRVATVGDYGWNGDARIYFYTDKTITTIDEFMNAVGDDMYVDYVLSEPIETDLTEEEMAQYNALVMNKGNNTLLNDAGAQMELEQVCDTQLHIEQNYIPKSEHEALKSRVSDIEQVIANL